jgi:hypothetical protein
LQEKKARRNKGKTEIRMRNIFKKGKKKGQRVRKEPILVYLERGNFLEGRGFGFSDPLLDPSSSYKRVTWEYMYLMNKKRPEFKIS